MQTPELQRTLDIRSGLWRWQDGLRRPGQAKRRAGTHTAGSLRFARGQYAP